MGTDIHLHIIDKNGEFLYKDLYNFRNYEWFDNLCSRGSNPIYDKLNIRVGLPPVANKEIVDDINEYGYYDPHYIIVKDYMDWGEDCCPEIDAGWVTTREKWLYDTKGVYPESIKYALAEDDIIEDMVFASFKDIYDPNIKIYNFCIDNEIPEDTYIVYYFDC